MQMKSRELQKIRNRLKNCLKDKKIYDIILFGSFIKGKINPSDIDLAFITNEKLNIDIEGFHISFLKPEDFFINPPSLINTLLREGYSIKKNKRFSEVYNFSNKSLFIYELKQLSPSLKVKIVNLLRGNKKEKGLVKDRGGEWLANQVFIVPVEQEDIFQKIFQNYKVKYKKFYILMH